MSTYPQGTLWVKPEYISISSAVFKLVLQGKGGHVALPHKVVDPITMVRTATPDERQKAIVDFERMVKGITATAGGKYKLYIEMANPSIINSISISWSMVKSVTCLDINSGTLMD